MLKEDLQKYDLPQQPGVYIFRNARRQRLYIGKATSLRERVRSYFGSDLATTRGPLLVKMLAEATRIEWEETDSVLEALILEANLIKKHQPPYNTKDKSNKSFNYVLITNEDYPRILIKRQRELLNDETAQYREVFGPFPQGAALRDALKIIRRIFPYRDTCTPVVEGSPRPQVKPCFNAQIGLCPGVCTGAVSKSAYDATIKHISLLFAGKKHSLIKELQREMRAVAKREDFEAAAMLRNQIFALEHINDVALTKGERGNTLARVEGYDVAHTSETSRVGVMTVLEDGEPNKREYKKFKIKTTEQGDIAALKELLTRRLTHNEWSLPNLIVVDGGKAQVNAARRILQTHFGNAPSSIPVVGVVKDDKHKPKNILGDIGLARIHEKEILEVNAEAHRFALAYHRSKRDILKSN